MPFGLKSVPFHIFWILFDLILLYIQGMGYEHVLDNMEVRTEPFALCELRGECELSLGRRPSATLHYILAGQGEIHLPGRHQIPVKKGTLVLIPAMHAHILRSHGNGGSLFPKCSPKNLNLAAHILEAKDTNQNCQLVALCTHITIGLGGIQNVIDLVREPMVEKISADNGLQASLKTIVNEVSDPNLGSKAMIRALLLQCVIELLRNRLLANDVALMWMNALDDPGVWKALHLMLDAPGDAHTVESLAVSVGMSRSTFAMHFSDAYGSGPMELLRNLRVQRAAKLLEESKMPIKRIAEIVGFRSRSAFTRMFTRYVGLPPQKFRIIGASRSSE